MAQVLCFLGCGEIVIEGWLMRMQRVENDNIAMVFRSFFFLYYNSWISFIFSYIKFMISSLSKYNRF